MEERYGKSSSGDGGKKGRIHADDARSLSGGYEVPL